MADTKNTSKHIKATNPTTRLVISEEYFTDIIDLLDEHKVPYLVTENHRIEVNDENFELATDLLDSEGYYWHKETPGLNF